MNNYCTNCGEKLKEGSLICYKCNTPVIKYKDDYKYKPPKSAKEKERTKLILKYIIVLILCIIAFFIAKFVIKKIKLNNLKNNYAIPYVENVLKLDNYKIKYEGTSSCVIEGNCNMLESFVDVFRSCDSNGGGKCTAPYQVLDGCTSYYYDVTTTNKNYIITVYYINGEYSVVDGRNIYGKESVLNSSGENYE